jgi:hypothetical protein
MPVDKPRIFSGDGPENTEEVTAKTRSTLRSQDSVPRAVFPRETVPDEELGLSAELQVLASHLRGEADVLDERYAPAARVASPTEQNRHVARRWVWQYVAVGLAGLALMAWRIERWQASPPVVPAESVAQTATPSDATVASLQQPTHVASTTPSPHVPLASPVLSSGSANNAVAADPVPIRHSQGIAEVGIDEPAVDRHPPADQVEMLRIQTLGFEKVIRKLQAELAARDAAQIESQRQIQSLQAEVQELHKQLDDMRR